MDDLDTDLPPEAEAPAVQVEIWPIARLMGYERNAKKHPAEQVAQLRASIEEFGWTAPILATTEGLIIAGHGRRDAAASMAQDGIAIRLPDGRALPVGSVPVLVVDGLTDEQRRAYTLADNKLTELGEWDQDLLRLELGDLQLEGFDVGLLGFSSKELESILRDSAAPLSDPEEIPEVNEAAVVSRPGDVWILGDHRIICGDSTDAATVERLLAGAKPHLMVTDPPYGVEYDARWRNDAVQAGNGKRGAPGGRAVGKVQNDDRADWLGAWTLFPGDVAYVWHAGTKSSVVQGSLERAGFSVRAQIVWVKNDIAIGRGDYHWKHEPCWYAVRNGAVGHWAGDRKQATVWEIDKPRKSETGHSTQKPVECMQRPIENNSQPGDAVYEPFSGSGTTIVAAEVTGRRCYAVELNPLYVDVAVRRWQSVTGKTAALDGDGRSFRVVELDRLAAQATAP